jgi:ATP-binding cassette subfamily F protein 3
MLTISNITCRLGDRTLFDGASARVSSGQKIGIVGENGSGKTTLLRLITAQLELDGGRIDIQNRCRVGAISQDAPGGSGSPLACVLEADDERASLLEAAEIETDPHEIARIHTRLAEIDAHSAPARAAVILAGLGFNQEAQQRPLSSFSGGWRMRVALAMARVLSQTGSAHTDRGQPRSGSAQPGGGRHSSRQGWPTVFFRRWI